MKSSLIYNPLVLAVITSLALSLTACGGGGSSSSSGNSNHSETNSSGETPIVNTGNKTTLELSPADLKVKGCSSFNDKKSREKILKQLNKIRAQSRTCYKKDKSEKLVKSLFKSAPALKWSDTLEKSTKKFANDMAENNYYNYFGTTAHLQPDTSKPKPWLIKDAITLDDRKYEFKYLIKSQIDKTTNKLIKQGVAGIVSENLAWSQYNPSLDSAVDMAYYGGGGSPGWLKSTHGHCENIMDPQVEDFAVTCAYNASTQEYYFVQMFGVHCSSEKDCKNKGLGHLIEKP